mmetsp:Transcript_88109/g.179803  ORF Transcript_88109/g.179803 Transcript_88109/m.179803 type:complete len:307 (-) Transcript_88109:82-1002(-)
MAADDATTAATTTTTTTVASEEAFVRAFDRQRTTLAGFSRCSGLEELRIVRDGFYLGLAKDLCPDRYKEVLVMVLRKKFAGEKTRDEASESDRSKKTDEGCLDTGIVEGGDKGMLSMSFEEMVLAARVCDDDDDENRSSRSWKNLVDSVLETAGAVGSDLESIWKTLEDGRVEWLRAVSAAHPIKTVLKKALEKDNATDSEGDVSDAMMVWIYAICLALAEGRHHHNDGDKSGGEGRRESVHRAATMGLAVDRWVDACNMADRQKPLEGYRAELWDPRRDEWRALETGAREASERGGADLSEAWEA